MEIFLDDLIHFLLDILEIIFRELLVHVDIIIEAILNRRPDGELYMMVLIQTFYRLCHDMRCRVAKCPAPIGILKGQNSQLAVLLYLCREIDCLIIHFSGQSLLGQAVAQAFYEIENNCPRFNLADRAIFQSYFQHNKNLLQNKNSPIPIGTRLCFAVPP